jgi:hypothetical protein
LLYSNGSFNDGTWHNVEIWFNGVTANPTILLYVDEILVGSITEWLCPIENTDFKYGKIGKRAQGDTDFFEGVLDELKIIKYPGGNEQDPPEISGPKEGDAGVEYDYTFVSNDPEGDKVWYYINWSDGNVKDWFGPFPSGEVVTVSHTWAENGAYRIRAKSMDVWDDSFSSYYPVRIGNHPPNAPEISGPQNGFLGVEYQFNFSLSEPDNDQMYLRVDWGSGTPGNWKGPYDPDETVKLKYTFTEKGTYIIRAQAKDIYDSESGWDEYTITITKSKIKNIPVFKFLENHPLLQYLLQRFFNF